MNTTQRNTSRQAFSRTDLLVTILSIVVIFAFAVFLILPMLAGSHKSPHIPCLSNLKQIALAESLYEDDNSGKSARLLSTNAGGMRELLELGRLDLYCRNSLSPYTGNHPGVFHCPLDKRAASPEFTHLTNGNISYFFSLNVPLSTNTNAFLAGDRNLAPIGAPATSGLMTLTSNSSLWWAKGLHNPRGKNSFGSIAFPDGHVAFISGSNLPAALLKFGSATNCLAFP